MMNRRDRRQAIFVDDKDRQLLLETLGEACQKTDWQGSHLVSDEQPFPSGRGDVAREPGAGDAVAAGVLYRNQNSQEVNHTLS
jgi:hypothetical protein